MEDNILATWKPQEEESGESYTRKSHTLEPFGRLVFIAQTKKLYTYNPFYDVFRNSESYTLDPREGVVALYGTKTSSLKLHDDAESLVSHDDKTNTSKPRGKSNMLSHPKILYSLKSRTEGSVLSYDKELYTSVVRNKADPVSQNKQLYVSKFINNRGVVPNKKLFKTKNPFNGTPLSPNKEDPVFLEYLYTPNPQSEIDPVSTKPLHKPKYLGKRGPLTQNKELYTLKSREKTGPVSQSKELNKQKSLYKSSISQNKKFYASKSRGKGDTLSPKELYTSKSRGKAGLEFPNKQLHHSKFLGIRGPFSLNKALYTSKSRGKADLVSPKELYTSKSRGKAGPVSQNKQLYTSKSRCILHASKTNGNGSIVSYYKELNNFKSYTMRGGIISKKKHSSKFRGNGNVSHSNKLNRTKSLSNGRRNISCHIAMFAKRRVPTLRALPENLRGSESGLPGRVYYG